MPKIAPLIFAFLPFASFAMPVKTKLLKPKAYFVEAGNKLLQPLDLNAKVITFTKREIDQCAANLMRNAQTLTYSCKLEIPSPAKISRLEAVKSSSTINIAFGGANRPVLVAVDATAKNVVLSTTFDQTGLDFEFSKFNEDFFSVYAKVAHLVISEAMTTHKLQLEVLESR